VVLMIDEYLVYLQENESLNLEKLKTKVKQDNVRSCLKNRDFSLRQGALDSSSAVYTQVNEQRRIESNAELMQNNIFATTSSILPKISDSPRSFWAALSVDNIKKFDLNTL